MTRPPEHLHTIEIRLHELAQLFHSLDPSPFHDRDLDRAAAQFLVEELTDVPARQPARVLVHVPAAQVAAASVVPDAIHRYFERMRVSAEHELRETRRFGRRSLVVGMLLVSATFGLVAASRALLNLSAVAAGVVESIVVVAWVVLWRPVELLLYDWWPIRRRIRLYRRLQDIEVVCRGT